MSRPLALVVYYSNRPKLRHTVTDHLYSLSRDPRLSTVYLNLAVRRAGPLLRALPFDMVVFDYTLLSIRFNRKRFRRVLRSARAFAGMPGTKVAIPQDEYVGTDLLCEFLEMTGVTEVLTATSSEADRRTLYGAMAERLQFHEVLTGYVSDRLVASARKLAAGATRPLDIGYRARRLSPALGWKAQMKSRIADAAVPLAAGLGLNADISTREEDTLLGEDWLALLSRSRATLGAEGGAAIHDRDGSLQRQVDMYLQSHPSADFTSVEQHCFPGRDGEIALFAMSPRHIEACATRTLQILVEGHYNGVLQAGRHYIPVKADLSDLRAALATIRDEAAWRRITDAAYRDVIENPRYHYAAFVGTVLDAAGRGAGRGGSGRAGGLILALLRAADRLSWSWVAVRFALYSRVTAAARRLPGSLRLT